MDGGKYRYMVVFMNEKFDINLFKTPIQYFVFILFCKMFRKYMMKNLFKFV